MSPLAKGKEAVEGQAGSSSSNTSKQSPDSKKRPGDAKHPPAKSPKSSRDSSPSTSTQTSPGRSQQRKTSSSTATSPSAASSSSPAQRSSPSSKANASPRKSSSLDAAGTASDGSPSSSRTKSQSSHRSPSGKVAAKGTHANDNSFGDENVDTHSGSGAGEVAQGDESLSSTSSSNSSYGTLQPVGDQYAEASDEDNISGDMSLQIRDQPQSLSSTVSKGAFHQCGTARRVKVYELQGETWFDRGTGYCAGVYDEQHDAALLVARIEEGCRKLKIVPGEGDAESEGAEDRSLTMEEEQVGVEGKEDRKHFMLVVSEALGEEELLLKTRVVKEDVYQRQQDTLVVWTEPDGTDMALSFQEADGCHEVWEFLTEVQKHFLLNARQTGDGLGLDDADSEGMGPGALGVSNAGMTSDGDLIMSDGSAFNLPLPSFESLQVIDLTLKDAASRSPQAREKVAEWILRHDYLLKLLPVFHDAEDLEQLQDLHRLCNIMHTVLMLNDGVLVERVLHEDVFLGAVGMLEYDPEFPRLKASYRDYLTHTTRFRQVVDIHDESILRKIHQTFRLQYLKDVVLARILDDSTFAVLNSLIFYHQADIVTFCTSSEVFLASLFQIFDKGKVHSEEKKADAIVFLQQLCAMGKQVQLPARIALYRTLVEWGLLLVLEYALVRKEARLRNAAAEVLMTITEYDAMGVRVHVLEQADKGAKPLITKCSDILHGTYDLGLKTQITESLRILFDSGPDGSSGGPNVAQTLAAAAAAAAASAGDGGRAQKDDVDRFLNWFYDGEVDRLFSPLRNLTTYKELSQQVEQSKKAAVIDITSPAQSALFAHLCDLLTFIMVHHHFRSQYWVISSDISMRVATLLFAREKHLRLTALRFFRACLAKGNQFINRHFLKIDLVSAVLAVVENECTRDNLVTSACLDFFEHVRKENMRPLIAHLMEGQESRVEKLTHNKSIGHYFQALILQWQKNNEAPPSSFNEGDSSTLSIQQAEKERHLRDLARRGDNRAVMDSDEENYFNEDEDEPPPAPLLPGGDKDNAVGIHTALGLVSYAGDDDDEEPEAGKEGGEEDLPANKSMEEEAEVSLPSIDMPHKRKKRGDDEEEEDDVMGRIAKRKTLSVEPGHDDDDFGGGGGFIREESANDRNTKSAKKFSINLSADSEKMVKKDVK